MEQTGIPGPVGASTADTMGSGSSSGDHEVTFIPHDAVDNVWGAVRQIFLNGRVKLFQWTTEEQQYKELIQQQTQLWIIHKKFTIILGAVITSISEYPNGKRSVVLESAAGSDLSLLSAYLDIEKWAREIGADEVEATVRPGLERFLRGFKFQQVASVMKRELR